MQNFLVTTHSFMSTYAVGSSGNLTIAREAPRMLTSLVINEMVSGTFTEMNIYRTT
jgi:hypothetical protein